MMNWTYKSLGIVLFAATYFLLLTPVYAQDVEPLSEADLIKRFKITLEDDLIVAELEKKGIGFSLDEAATQRLKEAGASEPVLAALKKADQARAAAVKPTGKEEPVIELSPEVKAQVEKLASRDVAVRRATAASLAGLNDKSVVPALIKALGDKDAFVRRSAANGLQKLGDKSAVPALVARISDDVNSEDEWGGSVGFSKTDALNALKALDAERMTGAIATALKSKNELVRLWACWLMAGQTDDKVAVEALMQVLLNDKDLPVRRAAAVSLGKLDDKAAVPALIKALSDKDATVRMYAANSLQKVADKGDKDAVAALVARISDDVNSEDEWGGSVGFSKTHALNALKALDPERMTGAIAAALNSKNELVRLWACWLMGGQTGDKAAVEALAQHLLNDKDLSVRRAAAVSLGKLDEKSAIPALIKALGDKDANVRMSAANSLQKVADKGDKAVVAALVARISDDV